MLYLQRVPASPLSQFVEVLWYARAPITAHRRERVLPTGRVQVILNLAQDFLLDCTESGPDIQRPPALVIGARTVYEIVHTSDMADLIGVVFQPDGFGVFAGDAVDLYSNRNVSLESIWGARVSTIRDTLRELPTPESRLTCFETFLTESIAPHLGGYPSSKSAKIAFALKAFNRACGVAAVRDVARQTGWSERRFSQVFREHVGLTPRTWCRVQRFQQAVRQLHAGTDLRWAELALDCGYFDQSHFANEFRAFSGIDATTYSARRTQWTNHIAAD